MDIRLTFKITLSSGEQTEQELSLPADPNKPLNAQAMALMQQVFTQYTQVGMLRQPKPGTFVLLCPSQIATVECVLPTIVIASAGEVIAPKISLD